MTNVSPWAEYLQLDGSLYLVLGAEGGPGEVGQEVGGQGGHHLVVISAAHWTKHAGSPWTRTALSSTLSNLPAGPAGHWPGLSWVKFQSFKNY